MKTSKLIGLNMKWYRYQNSMTQENLAEKTELKTAYISMLETGDSNITTNTIETIAKALNVKPKDLLDEQTAIRAKELPTRVDSYRRKMKNN